MSGFAMRLFDFSQQGAICLKGRCTPVVANPARAVIPVVSSAMVRSSVLC